MERREGSVSTVNNNFRAVAENFLTLLRPLLHAALLMAPVSLHMLPLYNLVEICMRSDSDTEEGHPLTDRLKNLHLPL